MAAAIPSSWALFVILAMVWVTVALHAALAMRRYGRRWWVWFGVSVFLTVIPAAICSYVDYSRQLRQHRRGDAGGSAGDEPPHGWPRRCRHCGAVLADEPADPGSPGPRAAPDRPPEPLAGAVCPRCGMAADQEHLA